MEKECSFRSERKRKTSSSTLGIWEENISGRGKTKKGQESGHSEEATRLEGTKRGKVEGERKGNKPGMQHMWRGDSAACFPDQRTSFLITEHYPAWLSKRPPSCSIGRNDVMSLGW